MQSILVRGSTVSWWSVPQQTTQRSLFRDSIWIPKQQCPCWLFVQKARVWQCLEQLSCRLFVPDNFLPRLLLAPPHSRKHTNLGVDSPFFFNHRSFQKPAVSPWDFDGFRRYPEEKENKRIPHPATWTPWGIGCQFPQANSLRLPGLARQDEKLLEADGGGPQSETARFRGQNWNPVASICVFAPGTKCEKLCRGCLARFFGLSCRARQKPRGETLSAQLGALARVAGGSLPEALACG